ncbi:MAG: adenylate/guanylate cyclase domain-containing protein [Spirulinaceae cyanobacterium]
MSTRLLVLLNSFKARLSRRVSLWVFASIVVIEAIILVPSYHKREQDLLAQQSEISEAVMTSITDSYQVDGNKKTFFNLLQNFTQDSLFLGVAVYDNQGQLVEVFGESPQLTYRELQEAMVKKRRSNDGNRYDMVWYAPYQEQEYIVIIRYDTSFIQRNLSAFTLRIAALVLLISGFVTLVTMIVLGDRVIAPVVQLRNDLVTLGEIVSQENSQQNFSSLSCQRNDELGEVISAFKQMYERISQEIAERKKTEAVLRIEQEKSEALLLNILPKPIAEQLKEGKTNIADGFADATILFADLVGFTELSTTISPRKLVELLNVIFSEFDTLCDRHGLEKIKTIGDAYMVVGGLPMPRSDHVEAVADLALEMQTTIKHLASQLGQELRIRIGIHTGAVVAGVIGKNKFIYDLWGDAVNIASRMESQGLPDCIQVTATIYESLQEQYLLKKRGFIKVKGKGEMLTYWLVAKK